MKKLYLKNMNDEQLKKLLENNKELEQQTFNACYDDNMDTQLFEYKELNLQGVECDDYYNSFRLYLKDAEKFIDNVNVDYMNSEAIELYYKIIPLRKYIEQYDFYYDYNCYKKNFEKLEEKYNKIYSEFEKLTTKLLKTIENQLHEYEDVTVEQMIDFIRYNMVEECEYFIVDNDYSTVYSHVNAHYVKAHDVVMY